MLMGKALESQGAPYLHTPADTSKLLLLLLSNWPRFKATNELEVSDTTGGECSNSFASSITSRTLRALEADYYPGRPTKA